jgi:aryl-alcohol dehydrogenase-like predicted oxidoreductase
VRNGLALLPYFPLASGLLTGKYRRDAPAPAGTRLALMPQERVARWRSDRNFDRVEHLEALAADQDRTLLELAFGWLAAQPNLASVIAGATRPDQVHANVAAVARPLSPDEMAAVDALVRGG